MIKHYCDFCGEEMAVFPEYVVKSIMFRKPNILVKKIAVKISMPQGTLEMYEGEPTGKIGFGETKEYEICAGCLMKIWEMRHDKAGS